ncbi:MAG: transcriptional regulator [Anaerolineales bacterium]|nr:transcriptional regulator [Anaerolineales bacterium]
MPKPEKDFTQVAGLDRWIHEPARLAIVATLAGCESADFLFLLNATGLNKGNLSAHAIKLADAGYIEIKKEFAGRMPHTLYRLTDKGRKALTRYRSQVRQLMAQLGDAAAK